MKLNSLSTKKGSPQEESPYKMNERAIEKFKELKEKRRIQNVTKMGEGDPKNLRIKLRV